MVNGRVQASGIKQSRQSLQYVNLHRVNIGSHKITVTAWAHALLATQQRSYQVP